MPSLTLAASSVATSACVQLRELKNLLHTRYPNAKSSHLTEAIACGMGYQTHAALLAALDSSSFRRNVRQAFQPLVMLRRLHTLGPAAFVNDTSAIAPQWQTPPTELLAHKTALSTFAQAPIEMQKRAHDWARHLHYTCGQLAADALDLGRYGRPEFGTFDTIWWTGVDHSYCLPGWGRSLGQGFFRFSDGNGHDSPCFRPLPLANDRQALYTSAVFSVIDAETTEQQLHDYALQAEILGWTCTRLEGWNWFTSLADGVLLCFRPRTEHAQYLRQWEGSFKQWLWSHRPRLLRGAGTARRKVVVTLSHCAHLPLECTDWNDFRQRFLDEYLAGPGLQLPASTPEICYRLWAQWLHERY